jgi:hypothetical protein
MPRQTAPTQTKPTRAPRKSTRASDPAKGGKPARGRQTAKTTGPAKANPFDDIARQVNADQEAKDREAGRADLTPALAKSVDQAKAKRAASKPAKPARPAKPAAPAKPAKPATPAKPARPTKVQAAGNGVTFSGRPTTKVETVAARAKEAGLRVRSDADIDAIATRLRATPDAVAAWLASRNGQQPAKAPTTAKAKPTTTRQPDKPKSDFLTGITLQHHWTDKTPDYLKGRTLVMRYQVRDDGAVFSTLTQLRDADGKVVPDFKDLPLDYRPTQERDGRNRAVILKDRSQDGLRAWLVKEGLGSEAT